MNNTLKNNHNHISKQTILYNVLISKENNFSVKYSNKNKKLLLPTHNSRNFYYHFTRVYQVFGMDFLITFY